MKWIFRALGALFVLIALLVGALFLLPSDRIAAIAAERIAAATGRSVEITGPIRPTLWPQLGVRAEGLQLGNPDWVSEDTMIAAEALAIRVPWAAAVSGRVEIDEILIQSPRITLIRASDGRANWTFDVPTTGSAAAPSATEEGVDEMMDFALDRAVIENGVLVYQDLGSGQVFELSGLNAEINLPRSAPALIHADVAVNGTNIETRAQVDDLTAMLDGGLSAVEAAVLWSGGEVEFTGSAGLAPALDGRLQAEATDLAPVMAILGAAAPSLPEGLGRDLMEADLQVTLASEGSIHIREGRVRLDDNLAELDLDVLPGSERPLIRGTLSSASFVLPEAEASAEAVETDSESVGWSREPIDVSGLFAADVELAVQMGRVGAAGLVLDTVDLRLTNTDGRAVVDIDGAGLYGGTLAGQFVANGRGGMSVRTDLFLVGVELAPLLEASVGYDRLQGRGSASLQVLGVGDDLHTLMRSLDGQGDLAIGAGAIEGLDIAGMIRNFDTSHRGEGARTVFDSVSGNFVINDGVLLNDDLYLDAPWGDVAGTGEVDLGGQTLDYRITPGVLRDESGVSGIQVPILITGPWADPSIRPDLEFLAEQELAEEADRLEDLAREQLDEVLDLDRQEGQSTEEAIQDRLLEEAGDALRNLLGGD